MPENVIPMDAPAKEARIGWDGLIGVVLAAGTIGLYWPATGYAFNNYDDAQYITANKHVLGGLSWANVWWALTANHAANWHPLTWLSHMLDCQLYGLNAGGHHFTNVLFHAASSVLLYALWRRTTGALWRSAFVAALFAWHPMHVESVAFVAERKDVLSAFFGLLTLLGYTAYAEAPTRRAMGWVMVGFALALLSKPMVVTLPLVMLLLDYWPLRRAEPWRQLLTEKIPLLAMSGASCIATVWAQHEGRAIATLGVFTPGQRAANATHAYMEYMFKLLWPRRLAVLYPFDFHLPVLAVAGAAALLATLTAGALYWGRSRRYLCTGWFWFLITLAPVIGIVQVGVQSMADRYSYLPSVGFFLVLTWLAADALAGRMPGRWVLGLAAAGCLAVCLVGTERQLPHWRDSETLFSRAVEVTPFNPIARDNLAVTLQEKGDIAGATSNFEAAVTEFPTFAHAWANLGLLLLNEGKTAEALPVLERAVKLPPPSAFAELGLARCLDERTNLAAALPHYLAAIALKPDLIEAQIDLGAAYATLGQKEKALERLKAALELDPHSWEANYQVGNLFLTAGKAAAAIPFYEEAASSFPSNKYVQLNLAAALERTGQTNAAIAAAERCLRLAANTGDAPLAERLKKQLAGLRSKP